MSVEITELAKELSVDEVMRILWADLRKLGFQMEAGKVGASKLKGLVFFSQEGFCGNTRLMASTEIELGACGWETRFIVT